MTSKDLKIVSVRREASNWYLIIQSHGFNFGFRIHFIDKTRKNARFEDLKVMTTYFEGATGEDGVAEFVVGSGKVSSGTYRKSCSCDIKVITDLLLFIERHQQWLLEHVMNLDRNAWRQEVATTKDDEPKTTTDNAVFCERCNERLDPDRVVWLEFAQNAGTYHEPGKIPAGDVSQGLFPFGIGCSRRVLMTNTILRK